MIFWIRFFFEVRLETVLKEVPTDAFLKVPANEPTLKYIFLGRLLFHLFLEAIGKHQPLSLLRVDNTNTVKKFM